MRDRQNPSLQIGRMNLRIPAAGADAGRAVAERLPTLLEQQLPAGLERHVGAMTIRVRVPRGASSNDISEAIAASIVKALKPVTTNELTPASGVESGR